MKSNIQEVIKNKGTRNQTPFYINGNTGEQYYLLNGMKVSEKVFFDMFPVDIIVDNGKGDNPERRNLYIKNKKSY